MKEQQLIKELEDTRLAIAQKEKNLSNLPTVMKMKEDLVAKIQSVKSIHRSMQCIPGFAETDQAESDEVDQIRLRVLSIVEQALQSM